MLFLEKGTFRRDYPERIPDKFKILLQSWNETFINVGPQYVITVIASVDESRDAARAIVLEFVREIAPILPEYGIY